MKFAYRSAGRSFIIRLEATFLVLIDGSQPTANFFVPASRVSTPLPVAGSSSLEVATDTRVPPPPVSTYLQHALSAPVPSVSGSGRKRPAEASESSSKRSAP